MPQTNTIGIVQLSKVIKVFLLALSPVSVQYQVAYNKS